MTPPTRLKLELPDGASAALPTGAARLAVEVIGRRIATDIYLPEQIMPTEPELAQSLNVSRATIRDAIKVLSGKGLVRTARRYGTRVRKIEEWNLLDPDVVSWHEHGHPRLTLMFSETTELRAIIEPEAAALAARRGSDVQIGIIMEAAHALRPDKDDVQHMFEADCRFHATILEATGNGMMRQLRPLILTMLRISYEYGVLDNIAEPVSREGHILVAEAIKRRDAASARREMARMLSLNQTKASGVTS